MKNTSYQKKNRLFGFILAGMALFYGLTPKNALAVPHRTFVQPESNFGSIAIDIVKQGVTYFAVQAIAQTCTAIATGALGFTLKNLFGPSNDQIAMQQRVQIAKFVITQKTAALENSIQAIRLLKAQLADVAPASDEYNEIVNKIASLEKIQKTVVKELADLHYKEALMFA